VAVGSAAAAGAVSRATAPAAVPGVTLPPSSRMTANTPPASSASATAAPPTSGATLRRRAGAEGGAAPTRVGGTVGVPAGVLTTIVPTSCAVIRSGTASTAAASARPKSEARW
jgi:hypothetical protein